MAPHSSTLAWYDMDGGAWWAAVHGVAKSRTRLSDFTFTFLFHALEREMATHSSIKCIKCILLTFVQHFSLIPPTGVPRTVPSTWSAAAAAKSLQSCPTLCDPIDGSPPGSPVPGILQARTLEWFAISFSNA